MRTRQTDLNVKITIIKSYVLRSKKFLDFLKLDLYFGKKSSHIVLVTFSIFIFFAMKKEGMAQNETAKRNEKGRKMTKTIPARCQTLFFKHRPKN